MKLPLNQKRVKKNRTPLFKFHLFVLGCQFNYYDAAKIAGGLRELGGIASNVGGANLVILLACSVRQKAADRILGHIRNWRQANTKIKVIVSACVLKADRPRFEKAADLVVDSQLLKKELAGYLQGIGIKTAKQHQNPTRQLHDFQKYNDQSAYLTISSGCNNFCTYCAVPYTRGREISLPASRIVREAKELTAQGITHIILLGQNVNSYGLSNFKPRDLRKNHDCSGKSWTTSHPSPFVELLNAIQVIDDIKKISFLSPNPQDFSADLIAWMKTSPKFSKILNLPMQSGSSKILAAMNRRYSQREYLSLVKKIRRAVPDIYLSTDIIVGFPGETVKDFNDSVKVVRQCRFDKAFVSIYSPRAGTVAATQLEDNIPLKEKKRRWQILEDLINQPKPS
jgi:tRNA-2-methylthio-N6-dimethylallyladenosine synthase